MMGGFGAKPKETPPAAGAGKGQRAYERQMRSFNGLREAGAEGKDVYVHRLADGDNKFVFAGKVAWSSGVTIEQALQVRRGSWVVIGVDWCMEGVGSGEGLWKKTVGK